MSRAISREERARRRAARLCIDCAARLQPEDTMCCVEHAAIRDRAAKKYRATAKAREVQAAWRRRRYRSDAAEGVCVVSGCSSPAAAGHRRCDQHRVEHKINQVHYAMRRDARVA